MSKLARSISALLLGAALLPSISFAADENRDKQLATLNGEPIMASELFTYAKVKNPKADLTKPEIQKQMIQAYIGRELLYQEALKQKIDQLPVVKMAMENQLREVISQAMIAKIVQENPVTDEQVRSFYDKQAAENKEGKKLPPYDQVSMQIRKILMEKTVGEYIQSLTKSAKVDLGSK